MSRPGSITVFTRRNPGRTTEALSELIEIAAADGVEVRVPADEVKKHGGLNEREGVLLGVDPGDPTDVAVVLGGDGTILSTLRQFAGRDVPVFAINYGAIGFLATVEGDDLAAGMRRALEGDYEVLPLPALVFERDGREYLALNDVSFHRHPELRVAELAYSVEDEQLGQVRCDGLVAATPAGSTGYNLANGGPVLAWGVEGYVVSFIAPHTLTARALVVAPDDPLTVTNRSREEPVDVTTDGRAVASLEPEESIEVCFRPAAALLAQLPGASFYHRLSEKFGRLAR